MTQETDPKHYLGHRQRTRERFLKDDGSTLADYELMEMLLMLAIPRRDVKPLAKKLIKNFGNFANAINMSDVHLVESGLSPNTIAAIKLVRCAAKRMVSQQFHAGNPNVITNYDDMIDYCRVVMSHKDVEEFRVFFLDAKLFIKAEKVMQQGSGEDVTVNVRDVIKATIDYNASSIVLSHNHPSGKEKPSNSDIEVTREIMRGLWVLGIKVHDHIIITKNNYYSFRDAGLIKYPEDAKKSIEESKK